MRYQHSIYINSSIRRHKAVTPILLYDNYLLLDFHSMDFTKRVYLSSHPLKRPLFSFFSSDQFGGVFPLGFFSNLRLYLCRGFRVPVFRVWESVFFRAKKFLKGSFGPFYTELFPRGVSLLNSLARYFSSGVGVSILSRLPRVIVRF